jgi:peptide chain release factor 1
MEPRLAARLGRLTAELTELEAELSSTGLDPSQYAELGRRHAELRHVVELAGRWQSAVEEAAEARELAGADKDMADEFLALAHERTIEADRLYEQLQTALVPKDPNDDRDAIVEVRAGTGGDEAALWAGDVLRMLERSAERHGLRVEAMDATPSELGGFSKVIVAMKGRGAYGRFKYEAGVHRVQRVPRTESQGRIHTSTATVAVLPEVEAVDVELDPADVRVDVFRSSGPGGQSVNTTDSAVRLTHEPTGLVVTCQDEKSQLQNKEKAFRILRARLFQLEEERRAQQLAGARRSMVKSGERSEKIRTYNFKEGRVTDHRIETTLYRLDAILDGDLDEFVGLLRAADAAEALATSDAER